MTNIQSDNQYFNRLNQLKMENFDNYKEKQNQEEKIGLMGEGELKFQRCLERENKACQAIVSLFETEQAANMDSKTLMSLVLETIWKASLLVESIENTEEHRMLKQTQEYLQFKNDELKYMELEFIKGNTFDDCIQYLESIACDALKWQNEELGKQISDRLGFFITELKKLYNK